jgi:hypothetical protein
MAAKLQLNNFRFSIYIDADGTVTLTDLPLELREVAAALDPSQSQGTMCPLPSAQETTCPTGGGAGREATAKHYGPRDERG